jgi:lipase
MRLHVHEWGDPSLPTLVCLHGVTGHGGRFSRLAQRRLVERFHVLAPDLRGHGRSSWEPPWRLEQFLDDVLETVPPEAGLWVGHSFGGRLLLELVAAHPDRVERALLLDPAIWVPPPIALEQAQAMLEDVSFDSVEEAVEARLASGLDHGAPRIEIEVDFGTHLERSDDGRLRFRYSRPAAVAVYGELARTPPLEPLTRPLRVARAVESRVCPPELVEAVSGVAGALLSVVELPGGHTVMWDAPDATAEAIEAFFDGAASGAAAQ